MTREFDCGTSLATKLVFRFSGAWSERVLPTICFTCPSWRSIHGLKRLFREDMYSTQVG